MPLYQLYDQQWQYVNSAQTVRPGCVSSLTTDYQIPCWLFGQTLKCSVQQSGRCDLAWAKCLKIISDGVQSCTRTWVPQQDLNINKVVNKFRAQVNASFNGTRWARCCARGRAAGQHQAAACCAG